MILDNMGNYMLIIDKIDYSGTCPHGHVHKEDISCLMWTPHFLLFHKTIYESALKTPALNGQFLLPPLPMFCIPRASHLKRPVLCAHTSFLLPFMTYIKWTSLLVTPVLYRHVYFSQECPHE